MASESLQVRFGLNAAADLSTKQYHFVRNTSTGLTGTHTAGQQGIIGVLQDKPSALGMPGLVSGDGMTKVVASGVIAKGALVTAQTNGRAMTAASGHHVYGTAEEAAAADGDIITLIQTYLGVAP